MIRYRFTFKKDGRTIEFAVDETVETGTEDPSGDVPGWLALDNHKCPQCTLDSTTRTTCPAALAIQPVVDAFRDHLSYEAVEVVVELEDSELRADAAMHQAVRSLTGLMLPLSACPVMQKLRPMARFHLPFGEWLSTVFRAAGMYLVAQWLRHKEGLPEDWDLRGLTELYKDVHEVNVQLAERIREASQKDAAINGLILLDTFTYEVERSIEQSLEDLKPLFSMYLAKP